MAAKKLSKASKKKLEKIYKLKQEWGYLDGLVRIGVPWAKSKRDSVTRELQKLEKTL